MSSIGATRDTVQKCFAILVLVMAPGIALAQHKNGDACGFGAPPPPQHSAPPPQHSAPPPSNNNPEADRQSYGGLGQHSRRTPATRTPAELVQPIRLYGNRGGSEHDCWRRSRRLE